MRLILATSNRHKAAEIERVLERPLELVAIDLPEFQTIAVHEVIEEKARAAYAEVGQPVLVEDTGLMIHSWQGLPGALVRWFLETVGNEGICAMLATFADRTATAVTCIGYFDGNQCHTFTGDTTGTIAPSPRGTHGFGWDPIFVPRGQEKSFAELTADELGALSMRRKATLALKAYLDAAEPIEAAATTQWPDPLQKPTSEAVAALLRNFWQLLAQLPDLLNRREYLVTDTLLNALRHNVLEMMLALNGIRYPQDTRHLNTYLSAQQRAAIEKTMILPERSPEAWIGQAVALVVIYRWYAPQLVETLKLSYPQSLETAVWTQLQQELSDWPVAVTTDETVRSDGGTVERR